MNTTTIPARQPKHFDPEACAKCPLWKRGVLKDVKTQCHDTCVFKEIFESPDDDDDDI